MEKQKLSPSGYILWDKPRYWVLKPYIDGLPTFSLKMQETSGYRGDRHQVYYKLTQINPDGSREVIFEDDDFGPPSYRDQTSAASMRELLSFLTLRKGDTDAEYFENYTPRQIQFTEEHAEALSMFTEDPEERGR